MPDLLARARVKGTAVLFFVLLAIEVFAGLKPRNVTDLADPWVLVGSAAVLVGLLIRSWAAGMLVKKKRLACEGPYALVRHPLYAGSILMMLGFCAITGFWLNVLAAALIAWATFGHAIRDEEAFLSAKFTDRWKAYAARAGRLVPRGIAGNLLAAWNFKRWWRNREYNAALGVALGWAAMWAWQTL